ncbi:MAG: hypothetical protein DI565_05545 [Ancylobacter novellus]|uniref:Glycosyl transferase family 1 domain-containing protein n=1 Tax=Ancylobacter novellus TaxID=921 RepID=A0A2W5KTL1_ANCNO|nr:MAG: hypothetical protein DI565_05545 [Ancylobacter novellus]
MGHAIGSEPGRDVDDESRGYGSTGRFMGAGELKRIVAEIGPRRVFVLSDRYPPDTAGGAELSLHLLMREAPLRDQAMVVTFEKTLASPAHRRLDGVDIVALPANAAWPLHRLSQDQVERLKRLPYGLKWPAFIGEAMALAARRPAVHAPAIALQLAGPPPGGVRMAHATVPEGRTQSDIRTLLDLVRPKVVHADNARSIMMAADALEGRREPFVALVRDHRFTSLRFDQTLAPLEPSLLSLRERLAAVCARTALAFRQTCLKRASSVVATSAHLAETLSEVVAPSLLKRLPLEPVELPPREEKPETGAFSILLVGSLSNNKGQAHLIEAWPEILRRIPNARIDVAGQGRARAEIEALIARHGAASRITLHGHVDASSLAVLYRRCDVVALPTLWSEPFGRVPLEAGAAFRPVVAYAVGGLAETIVDGVTGRMIPWRDRAGFVEALADLAEDPATRRRMGEAGHARVVETYSPTRLAAMLASVWDQAAAGKR